MSDRIAVFNRIASPASTAGSNSLKATVMDAALKILQEEGLHLGADSISYAKVFAHIEEHSGVRVTRGSVHERIWAGHDDFRREVLSLAVAHFPEDYVLGAGNVLKLIKAQVGAGHTADELIDTLARRMIPMIVDSSFTSPAFLQTQSIKALVSRTNDPAISASVQEIMLQRSQERMENRRSGMALVLRALGVQPRTDLNLTTEEFSDLYFVSTWAMIVGAFLNARSGCDDALESLEQDLGATPDNQPWLILSVGARALVKSMTEPSSAPPDPSMVTGMVSFSNALSEGEHMRPEIPLGPAGSGSAPAPAAEPARRRSRAELKELVLNGGLQVLRQGELQLRPETLSYAAVFARVKQDTGQTVNRASVHKRFWASHGDFCLDVLTTSLEREPLPDLQLSDLPDPESGPPTQVAVAALRHLTLAALEVMTTSPGMTRRTLIKAAMIELDQSDSLEAVRRQVRINEQTTVQHYAGLLQSVVLDVGYEVRPELELTEAEALHMFAVLFSTVINGVAFEKMSAVLGDVPTVQLPKLADITDATSVGAAPDPQPWSVAEVAVWAIFEHLYRPTQR